MVVLAAPPTGQIDRVGMNTLKDGILWMRKMSEYPSLSYVNHGADIEST